MDSQRRFSIGAVHGVAFGLWLTAAVAFGQEIANRGAVPTAAEQQKAQDLIQEVFKDDFAKAKTPSQKLDLAKKLLVQAMETKDDPASRYVLLREAQALAVAAGDWAVAMQAVTETADRYAVDRLGLGAEMLAAIAKTANLPSQHKAVVEGAERLIDEAVAADQYDAAKTLGGLALASARAAKEPAYLKKTTARVEEIDAAASQFTAYKQSLATLEQKPTDPDANLIVGKFRCLAKGDWDGGLAMLALGSDASLKALAVRELNASQTAAEQMKIGDDWWELAEKGTGPAKTHLQNRAAFWYRKNVSGLSGLARTKVDRRLKELAPVASPSKSPPAVKPKGPEFASLFDGRSLKGWTLQGAPSPLCWSASRGELACVSPQPRGPNLITDKTFKDFELQLEFLLQRGANSGIYLRGRYEIQLADTLEPVPNSTSCGAIYKLITPNRQAYLGADKWNTLQVKLVSRTVTVTLNDKLIIDAQPITGVSQGAMDNQESQPGPILLQCHTGSFRFRNLRIRSIE